MLLLSAWRQENERPGQELWHGVSGYNFYKTQTEPSQSSTVLELLELKKKKTLS